MDMSNYWLGFDATADYNHLATVRKNVMSVDSIKEWYEKRPKSEAYWKQSSLYLANAVENV